MKVDIDIFELERNTPVGVGLINPQKIKDAEELKNLELYKNYII